MKKTTLFSIIKSAVNSKLNSRLILKVNLKVTSIVMMILAGSGVNAMETVQHVDLNRYLGTWYEVARFPNWFEQNCYGTTATYSLRDDGDVKVFNQCHEGNVTGPIKSATGKAWVADKNTDAKLKVEFFWPFSGDYWILDLGENYEFALVGEPGLNYLWFLSRTPSLSPEVYERLSKKALEEGYDLTRLEKVQEGE